MKSSEEPAVQRLNKAGVEAIPDVTSSTPPLPPGVKATEQPKLPSGLEPTHQGMYNYTDKYLTKAYLVRDKGKVHVNLIGTGKVITLPDEVIKAVMEGGTVN